MTTKGKKGIGFFKRKPERTASRPKAGAVFFEGDRKEDPVVESDLIDRQEVGVEGASGEPTKTDSDEKPQGDEAPPLEENLPKDGVKAVKPERPKKAKRVKAPKPKRAKAELKADEEVSLPVNVNVDFYRGVTKERDAEQIARAFVEKHFKAPNASYVYVQRWADGCAVEMQEGGGKAYLPELLAKLDEDEQATVALPMSDRVLQVRLDPDTRGLEALLLTARQQPPEGSFIAFPTKNMIPMDTRGSRVFIAGMGFLGASAIALVFSLGALFIDTEAWALPHLQQTNVEDLPSAQTSSVMSVLSAADCVAKMEFAGGKWNIVPGWDDGGGMCSSSAQPSPEPIVEEFPGGFGDGEPPSGDVPPGFVPPPEFTPPPEFAPPPAG